MASLMNVAIGGGGVRTLLMQIGIPVAQGDLEVPANAQECARVVAKMLNTISGIEVREVQREHCGAFLYSGERQVYLTCLCDEFKQTGLSDLLLIYSLSLLLARRLTTAVHRPPSPPPHAS